MLGYLFILYAFNSFFVTNMYIVQPGPLYPPTKGEVWPKPQQKTSEQTYFKFSPAVFSIEITNLSCPMLARAIERYGFIARNLHRTVKQLKARNSRYGPRSLRQEPKGENFLGQLSKLEVELTSPCDEYPYFGMDESYNLTVSTTSQLQSASIWGILRGLETWTQLFYISDDDREIRINKTNIVDYPRYAHRGVLLDTSRHYISMVNILRTLDAMAMNKFNVFHWHIVDDQSFPYQSEKFPDLSRLGAYHSSLIYSKNDITRVINYARERGIRVLPEFDVPGHTRSWGVAYPNILTKCYIQQKFVGLGPMDPTKNLTYKFLQELFDEVQNWFPDKYFHVGGDEVDLDCWKSNPDLQEYMKMHNLTSVSQLHAIFMKSVIPLLGDKSKPIVWQEVFDENVPLSNDTIIQVWKNDWISEILKILSAGHKVIFSSSWYLDHLKTGGDWVEFYSADPRKMMYPWENKINVDNIVGGEACMWGEVVDDANVISRVWPRASAVAEKLWSAATADRPTTEVYRRLEEHTCRMKRRGIQAQPPSGPGFCVS